MATQMEKRISREISPQSILLANQARLEQVRTGIITTKCPECQECPTIITTPGGERTIVACKCGFVRSIEINL